MELSIDYHYTINQSNESLAINHQYFIYHLVGSFFFASVRVGCAVFTEETKIRWESGIAKKTSIHLPDSIDRNVGPNDGSTWAHENAMFSDQQIGRAMSVVLQVASNYL